METLSIKKNIPNILSIFRIILVIPIIVLMLIDNISEAYHLIIDNHYISISINNIIVLSLFILASFTDWLDGYLSRKYNWISDLGKILDPIADKILINSILILLSVNNIFYVAFTIIFLVRDTIIDAIRVMAAKKGIIIAADMFGKLKTVFQMLGIIIILVIGTSDNTFSYWYWAVQSIVLYLALLTSVLSGFNYCRKYYKISMQEKTKKAS